MILILMLSLFKMIHKHKMFKLKTTTHFNKYKILLNNMKANNNKRTKINKKIHQIKLISRTLIMLDNLLTLYVKKLYKKLLKHLNSKIRIN